MAAAFAVVNRIDDFAYTPEQNIAHAMTALMAQNKGAGKKERMREGFRCGMKLELIYGVAVFAVCFLFARPLMLLFVKDEEVIRHGVSYLHLIAAMYLLPAATNGIQGYFRGIGDLKITLISGNDDNQLGISMCRFSADSGTGGLSSSQRVTTVDQDYCRVKKQLNPKLKVEGILLTMVDYRTNYARDISLMVYDTYSASIKVFGSEIPMSVRAAEVSKEKYLFL